MKPVRKSLAFLRRRRLGRTSIYLVGILAFLVGATSSLGAPSVTLTINPTSISFASADPDSAPLISANTPVTLNVRVTGNPGGSWRLVHRAATELQSGANSISISNITWTASPSPPFINGTMSAFTDQQVAAGTGNANVSGILRYQFRNQWNYQTGNYTATTTFTLSAP